MSGWRELISDTLRSLWHVLAVYLVAAWAVYQVALGLTEGLGLPAWVPALALVLIAAGLPVVLATALVQRAARGRAARTASAVLDPTLFPEAAGGDVVPAASGVHRLPALLTWRRSLGAGVLAFAALALGTTGFMAMRHYGIGPVGTLLAQGVIGDGEPVLLADFVSSTRDSTLGGVVTEALRIDLAQSDMLRLEDPGKLRAALERMQRDPAEGLPVEVARELAIRDGYRAVIAGEIASLGAAYVLTARVLRADSGTAVASFKVVARDSTELIDAVESLSREIRGKAGESLRNVRAAPPLAQVSTTSLPALRRFSEASRVLDATGDQMRALPLLQEAVALDSAFGMAWRRLGTVFVNLNGLRRGEQDEAFRRAYALRDRMSELERHLTDAAYLAWVEGDTDGAIRAYRTVLELDPGNEIATNNLPLRLVEARRFAEAEAILAAVPERDRKLTHWANLMDAQAVEGRLAEARATFERARTLLPEAALVLREADFAFVEGRAEIADSLLQVLQRRLPENRFAYLYGMVARSQSLLAAGRLREASLLLRELAGAAVQGGFHAVPIIGTVERGSARLQQTGQRDVVRRALDSILVAVPLASLPPADRPYLITARLLADLGELERATRLVQEYRASVPPRLHDPELAWTEAHLQLRRGDAAGALPAVRKLADTHPCVLCLLPLLAETYDGLGRADSARAVYERYLSFPALDRRVMDARYRGPALFRAAELHEQAGDLARARARYAELTRLWARADADVQPRVRAAQARLVALGVDR